MGDSRGQAKAATMETQGRARLLQPRLLRSPWQRGKDGYATGSLPALPASARPLPTLCHPPPPAPAVSGVGKGRGVAPLTLHQEEMTPPPAEKGDPLQTPPVSKPGEREMKLGLVST